jgi:hypothetical protein
VVFWNDMRVMRGILVASEHANECMRCLQGARESEGKLLFRRDCKATENNNEKSEARFSKKPSLGAFITEHSTLWWFLCEMSALASTTRHVPRVVTRGTRRARARRVVVARLPDASVPKAKSHRNRVRSRGVVVSSAISSVALVASVPAPAIAASQICDVALSDAWFGWYFAPGGVVLGPALFFAVWLLGQAAFEKITGTGPKGKK